MCFGEWSSLAAILLCCIVIDGETFAADKPNIVYILADDLGYGDLGCYNPESKIPTPRLDQLAKQGMRFTDAHSHPRFVRQLAMLTHWPICVAHRLQRNVLGPWDKPLIAADRLTVGKMLQQHGYTTACIGKWHLGQKLCHSRWQAARGWCQKPTKQCRLYQADK